MTGREGRDGLSWAPTPSGTARQGLGRRTPAPGPPAPGRSPVSFQAADGDGDGRGVRALPGPGPILSVGCV